MNTLSAEELEDNDDTEADELEEPTDKPEELDEATDELDEDAVDELDATLVVVDVVDDVPDEAREVLAELTSLDIEFSEERLMEEDEMVTAQEASKNANPAKAMVKNDFFFMVFPLLYKIDSYYTAEVSKTMIMLIAIDARERYPQRFIVVVPLIAPLFDYD